MINKIKSIINYRLIALLPYIIGASLFIVVPVIMLISKSSQHLEGLDNGDLWKERSMWHSIGISTYMGLIAALISLIFVFPFVWVVARSENKLLRTLAITLMVSPLFIFSVVKVFSLKVLLLKIYDDNYLPQKQMLIVLGMIYLYSPYMVIPLYSVIRTFPNNLLEASNDLGYNKFTSIFKVVLPYCLKAIFSGVAVVFMLSATTLVMSNTLIDSGVSSPHTRMIGNIIDQSAKSINLDKYSAIRTSTIALITIGVMMAVYATIYATPLLYRKIKGGINV